MATSSVTHNFVVATPAVADNVDQNFTDVTTFLNNQVVHRDGTKAMTAAFDAGSQKLVNVAAGTVSSDAVNKGQLDPQTDRMSCFLSRSVAQSIPNSAVTDILFDVEAFDIGGLHSTSVNTDRITIPAGGAGLWMFGFTVSWADNATGIRNCFMKRNNASGDRYGNTSFTAGSTGAAAQNGTTLIRLVATDFMELAAFQTSGGALNVNGDATNVGLTTFWAHRLGD